MTIERKTLTRGEIAIILGVSKRTVASCERVLGLDKARISASKKTVLYSVPALRRELWFRSVENKLA